MDPNIAPQLSAGPDRRFFHLPSNDDPGIAATSGAPFARLLHDWLGDGDVRDVEPMLSTAMLAGRRDFRRAFACVVDAAPRLITGAAGIDAAIARTADDSPGGVALFPTHCRTLTRASFEEHAESDRVLAPVICTAPPRVLLGYALDRDAGAAACGVWSLHECGMFESFRSARAFGINLARLRLADARPLALTGPSACDFALMSRAAATVAALAAATVVGVLENCLDASFDYAKHRITFAKPILQHQAVALRLADIVIAYDTLRLMTWWMADRIAHGAPTLADIDALATHVAAAGHQVTRDALQIFAGHGYVGGTPVAAAFGDVKAAASLLAMLVAAI